MPPVRLCIDSIEKGVLGVEYQQVRLPKECEKDVILSLGLLFMLCVR